MNWVAIIGRRRVAHRRSSKSDGTLWAWGYNGYGQIGDGSGNVPHYSPGQVGNEKWASISAGARHTLALKSDGTLLAWGFNSNGQLGDGTTTDRSSPYQITTSPATWVSVKSADHTLGLKADGTLWAWGYNTCGQLGDGTTTDKHSPVQIGTDNKWMGHSRRIWNRPGATSQLGVKADGTIWAWGIQFYGQLGDGTTTDKHSPVRIGTDNKWITSAAGPDRGFHTLAVKTDGTLWAWGYNGGRVRGRDHYG